MAKLKILIVCEHASNLFGGEAILPLNYFRYLSKSEHDVYLITHERVKASIQQLSEINQNHVFYIPDTHAHKLLHRYSHILPERLSVVTFGIVMHLITQFYQWKLAREIVKQKQIDVIHEPAPVSAIQPSAMFALGAPVVIGPMNGGMSFPPAFQYMASWPERILYRFIRMMASIGNLIIPGKFLANTLLVANTRTRLALPRLRLGNVVEIVENGVFSSLDQPRVMSKNTEVNVLYVGRLIDLKMIDVAINAVEKCTVNVRLSILGDGPQRKQLESYVQKNCARKVSILGAVPHTEVNAYYDKADIFVLPSVRECGGAVVLEAMSRGIPVVAVNWGGPADYVTTETGFLVEPKSREYLVQEFARIITQLAEQPELRYRLGQASIKRIKQYFLWDNKVEKMIEIYKQAIQSVNVKRRSSS